MTAFTVRMLALVASLPLLLPTSVCVCDAGSECCAPAAVVAAESHDCCDECHDPSEPASSEPIPTDDHVPSCPAEKLNAQWTKPSPSPSVDAVPSTVAVFESPIRFVGRFTVSSYGEVGSVSALPRYLSYCTFLL